MSNQLPIGWASVTLDDVCDKDSSSLSMSKLEFEEGNYPLYGAKGFIKNISFFHQDRSYISIIKDGAGVGRVMLLPKQSSVIGTLQYLLPNENIDKIFLFFFLQSIDFSKYISGSTIPHIYYRDYKKHIFLLPPAEEQKRIVTKIEKLFSSLDNSDKYLSHLEKQLKRYRQSVLKSAFEGELTREWREKQRDLESADELLEKIKNERIEYIEQEVREKFEDKTEKWIASKIKKEADKFYKLLETTTNINNDLWINIPLEAITTLLGDGLHGTPKYVENSEYYFVNGNNLQHGKLLIKNDTKSVSEEEYLKYKKNMNLNTILVSINGTLGNVAFFNDEKVMLGKSACYFNLLKPINKQYIFWRINSHEFRVYADKSATGSTIKNLPLSAMRKYKIPICSNAEQTEIIKQIDKHMSIIDKLEVVVHKSIKESKRLRQSILKQAFEGKLVKQDPNDESAEKLLEKIAKAKEEYKKEMSKRKKK